MTQMAQEFVESQPLTEKPAYSDWLRGLKQKVQSADADAQEETRWKLRYGKG